MSYNVVGRFLPKLARLSARGAGFLFALVLAFAGPAQAASMLPSGYLSTNGNQIVSSNGTPVRLACAGMFDWSSGGTLSIQQDFQGLAAAGFNCIRYPWYDATLQNSLNIVDQMVTAANQYGIKIIMDHHGNEASLDPAGSDEGAAYPCNGLWYDAGGASQSAGCPTGGTYTDAQVIADWVTVAQHYAGNTTVIGFDLQNEPHLHPSGWSTGPGGATWGNYGGGTAGSDTDIQSFYSRAAAAIEQYDPGVLIICMGVGNNLNTLYNGASPNGAGWDLTVAASDPVQTTVSNKLVYEEHNYPDTIAGQTPTIAGMNTSFGFLETQNLYPVWFGEMGASLDGSLDGAQNTTGQAVLQDEQGWAATLVGYINGQDGSQGGPTFSGNQQPMSTDWWAWGYFNGQAPDGTLTSSNVTALNSGQKAVYTQIQYTPGSAPTCSPVSANDATVTTVGPTICDSAGNTWALTSSGQISLNGSTQSNTANVIELAYVSGVFWQENASDLWYEYVNGGYTPENGTTTNPITGVAPTPASPSASNNYGSTGNNWYVNNSTGSDNNVGTSAASPFASISKGLSVAQPGDTVHVQATSTTYPAIYSTTNGSKGSPITLIGVNSTSGAQASIVGSGQGTNGIFLNGVNDFNVVNFNVTAPNTTSTGIFVQNSKRIGLYYNVSHDNPLHGIGIDGSDMLTVEYNVSYNNSKYTCGDIQSSGISLYDLNLDSDDPLVSGQYRNIVANNYSFNNTNTPCSGNSNADSDGSGIIIDDNLHTQGESGPAYAGLTLVMNNVIFGNGGRAISLYNSANVTVAGNTTYKNNQDPYEQNYEPGEILSDNSGSPAGMGNIAIIDNVTYSDGANATASGNHGAYSVNGMTSCSSGPVTFTDGTGYVLTGNTSLLLQNNGSAASCIVNGSTLTFGDPKFTQPTGNTVNFSVTSGSPAISQGSLSAITGLPGGSLDVLGTTRASPITDGAYQTVGNSGAAYTLDQPAPAAASGGSTPTPVSSLPATPMMCPISYPMPAKPVVPLAWKHAA